MQSPHQLAPKTTMTDFPDLRRLGQRLLDLLPGIGGFVVRPFGGMAGQRNEQEGKHEQSFHCRFLKRRARAGGCYSAAMAHVRTMRPSRTS